MAAEANGNGHPRGTAEGRPVEVQGHSGRRFLVVSGLCLLLVWGGLFVAFREWRSRYRERAAFGVERVLPAIDGLAAITPPEGVISPAAWRDAVDQTRAMLRTVVASNLLDRGQMETLRAELEARVERAGLRPETAAVELAEIWDEMADRAEFLLTEKDRHPRPDHLPPRKPKPR